MSSRASDADDTSAVTGNFKSVGGLAQPLQHRLHDLNRWSELGDPLQFSAQSRLHCEIFRACWLSPLSPLNLALLA
jgi:hypothetical protein